ncbi:glycosyltransferase family 2 protein, partial [Streptomyces ardesiacus]
MPRFSIVIPVFKVQGYLRECLDSVVGQSYRDIEVIAVDDCSPDSCGAIIDEYAARDDRVKAVHLPENVGLGRARNAGLRHARGDYVLFLDSDDTYTPGLLEALAGRLDAVGELDILVFDHVRTYWWGRGGRSQTAGLFEKAGTDVFRLRDRPEYVELFLVAWNKAFRREFFLGQGLQYAPGLYE